MLKFFARTAFSKSARGLSIEMFLGRSGQAQVKYSNGIVHFRDNYLKTLTKVGIVFLIVGFLLFTALIYLVVMFAVGGGPGSPGLPSPLGEFVLFFTRLGAFWFFFVIMGAVLIVAGAFQRKRAREGVIFDSKLLS